MPRIYLTPAELSAHPLGIALTPLISQLGTGVLDTLLARSSQRCDNYCEKRLQAPGSSTLSASVSANATSISVVSTLTLDDLAEQAVIVDYGNSNQETVLIQPGGVSTTTPWVSPYPGTITLASPLMFGHSSGAPVQFVYKEVREANKASQSDPYSEALQNQAAQLALAHLPAMHVGLTRITFLDSYPIQTVLSVEHAYSFDTTYNLIYNSNNPTFTGAIIIDPTAGFIRYRVGTVITPEGFTRTTYVGGYNAIPDDVKNAMIYYMSDELQFFVNPFGMVTQGTGKQRQSSPMVKGKTPNVQRAEDALKRYRRCT